MYISLWINPDVYDFVKARLQNNAVLQINPIGMYLIMDNPEHPELNIENNILYLNEKCRGSKIEINAENAHFYKLCKNYHNIVEMLRSIRDAYEADKMVKSEVRLIRFECVFVFPKIQQEYYNWLMSDKYKKEFDSLTIYIRIGGNRYKELTFSRPVNPTLRWVYPVYDLVFPTNINKEDAIITCNNAHFNNIAQNIREIRIAIYRVYGLFQNRDRKKYKPDPRDNYLAFI